MAKSGAAFLSALLGGAIVYLGVHAVTGHQGLIAYVDLQAEERALETRLAALEARRASLETRAARMRVESLDIDYLDERARLTLAAGDREEIVFALD